MKILVPVDGSNYSKAAVEFIASRDSLIGTEPDVVLLNVQTPIPAHVARVCGKEMIRGYHEDEANRILKPLLEILEKAGVNATAIWRSGRVGEEIARIAERDAVDLIVMGARGLSAISGFVVGSATTAVLAHTRHPVLLVRDKPAPRAESLKVGIAVDGSKYGRAAVKYVLRHAELFGTHPSITLIHVVPDFAGTVMPDMAGIALPAFDAEEIAGMQTKAWESVFAPVRKLLARAKVPAEEARLVGNAGDAIADYAKQKRLDVVVMGSHGRGGFKAAVLGSTATRVAAKCTTPLLVVRDV